MNSLVFAWHELLKNPHPFAILASARTPASDVENLPPGDAHYILRWSLIKAGFSRRLAAQ
ncbi:MAG: hypothetical protein Q8L02_08530 [Candidatus Nitrotoga sp.]|nr:hypothetical protein [Candidatus Nitrotoga sp.]